MNICFMSRVFYLGGVSTHLIDLSEELIKGGHKVSIITSGPIKEESLANKKLFDSLLNLGVEYIHIDFPKRNINKFNYLLGLLKGAWNCIKVLKSRKFDIVHVHTPILSFIPKLAKIPFIRTTHLHEMKLSFLDIKADYEIAISKEIYNEAMKKYKYYDGSIDLIHNGVSRDFYQPQKNYKEILELKKIYNIQDKIVIGLVGSLYPRKGHDVLINAISLLPDHIKSNLHILFLGDGERDFLINLIKEKKLSHLFTFLSFQDPSKIYPLIDIKVLPSRKEGFPLVAIEAMLMGCCVIRSNTEGAAEQIIHGKTGFIFENENYSELSNILLELIENKELRDQVSQAGQTYALQHFISDIMVDKTLTVYQKALREKIC